jgi:hypothetical protein
MSDQIHPQAPHHLPGFGAWRDGCADDRDGRFSDRRSLGRWQFISAIAHTAGADGAQVAETAVRDRCRPWIAGALHPRTHLLDRGAAARADRYSGL